eukprot:g14893.t1
MGKGPTITRDDQSFFGNFVRETKNLDDLLKNVQVDPDPPVGSAFITCAPKVKCQRDISVHSLLTGADLIQNQLVYCASACVWLDAPFQDTCRMPIWKQAVQGLTPKQRAGITVHWVTYYEGQERDPMKRYQLVPDGDELLYFRAWLAHRFGKMMRGADGAADTSWWYKFYLKLDLDRSNSVSMEEFQHGLSRMRYPDAENSHLNQERRANLLRILDTDGSGDLSFEEFAEVLGIDPKEVAEKVAEFKADHKERDFMQRINKVTFTDEECYIVDPKTGKKTYSIRQAYNNLLRNRDNASRKKMTTDSQRHVEKIYLNKWTLKSADNFGSWITTSQTKGFRESDLWAKHPKVFSCRLGKSGQGNVPKALRSYFGVKGKYDTEDDTAAQLTRDAVIPEKRLPIEEEIALLRAHMKNMFGDLRDENVRQKIFTAMDANGDGQVTALEFQQALAGGIHWPSGPSTHNAIKRRRRIFFHLDRDCSGELDLEEVTNALLGDLPNANSYGSVRGGAGGHQLDEEEEEGNVMKDKDKLNAILEQYKNNGGKGVLG